MSVWTAKIFNFLVENSNEKSNNIKHYYTMNAKINKLHSKYNGLWVSVSEDYSRVFASSKNLDNLVKEIDKKKLRKGMIVKVPTKVYSAYVG